MNDVQDNCSTLKPPGGSEPGQIVLVLQGGGALGSYQAGVYQALHSVHEGAATPHQAVGAGVRCRCRAGAPG
jgi:NTE family protein